MYILYAENQTINTMYVIVYTGLYGEQRWNKDARIEYVWPLRHPAIYWLILV